MQETTPYKKGAIKPTNFRGGKPLTDKVFLGTKGNKNT